MVVDKYLFTNVKPDYMSPMRNGSELSRHGHKYSKMYGFSIVSVIWPPHVKPMWAR